MKSGKPATKANAGRSQLAAHDRMVRWVEAMLTNGGNQTQAAVAVGVKAGFAAEKYGYRLSKNVRAQSLLRERQAERIEKAKATSDEVLISATRQVRFDPRKLVNAKDEPKKLSEWDEDTALGAEVIELKGLKVRVNRGAAREQLMKHLGLFEKDNRQKPSAVVHMPGVKTVRFEPLRARKSGS